MFFTKKNITCKVCDTIIFIQKLIDSFENINCWRFVSPTSDYVCASRARMIMQEKAQRLYCSGECPYVQFEHSHVLALICSRGLQTGERRKEAPRSLCCVGACVWKISPLRGTRLLPFIVQEGTVGYMERRKKEETRTWESGSSRPLLLRLLVLVGPPNGDGRCSSPSLAL